MAVIRCPKHGIPYNEDNPRGCPACWREKQGEDDTSQVMRQLARASKGAPAVEILPTEPDEGAGPTAAPRPSGPWPPPVTTPPRVPTPEPTRLERLVSVVRAHALTSAVIVLGIVGLWLLYLLSRPTFQESYIPPLIAADARPFPVEPNVPIVAAFALLGTVSPQLSPDSPTLARYDFGEGAVVDALNGVVYTITLTSPTFAWRGHRVGLGETPARGQLALLGPVLDSEPPPGSPFPVGRWVAFRDENALPRQTLAAEVRPPNGCFDVRVELAPQVIGTATRGEETFVAVARRGAPFQWVVHRVRIVNRAVDGPAGRRAGTC